MGVAFAYCEVCIIKGLDVTVSIGLRALGARDEAAGLVGRERARLGGVATTPRIGVPATLRTGVEKRLEPMEKALDVVEKLCELAIVGVERNDPIRL